MSATIESQRDPRRHGRTVHRITGHDAGSVQAAIDALMAPVDEATGYARFTLPCLVETDDGWRYGALGEVVIEQVPA